MGSARGSTGVETDLAAALEALEGWLDRNGVTGYDPYDVKGLEFVTRPRTLAQHARRFMVLGAEALAPLTVRRALRVEPTRNAKGLGLLAEAYRLRYEVTGGQEYLRRAIDLANWLLEHPSVGYSGLAWGYPFDWQSRVFIPSDTPSAVVSSTVGHALWGLYETTDEERYLDACRSICEFFLEDLHIDVVGDEATCFSYTPVDRFHVHNANLFVSEFLIRVGRRMQEERLTESGAQALRYTLSEQNPDGSLCYWGSDQDDRCRVDHYHSGFEIRSLHRIWRLTQDEEVEGALRRYVDFYCAHLFDDQLRPKWTPTRRYPVNIHSCAEAILCHATLAADFERSRAYLNRTLEWTLRSMRNADGSFVYMRRRLGPLRWTSRIPYLRWGQAWMFLALATARMKLRQPAPPPPADT
jgi:rhamnogalacturonyl hydrolase YesR